MQYTITLEKLELMFATRRKIFDEACNELKTLEKNTEEYDKFSYKIKMMVKELRWIREAIHTKTVYPSVKINDINMN